MTHQFEGTGVALVTPFNKDKAVDFIALERLVNHVIEGGIDYMVVLGTTGETPTLTHEEKLEVAYFVKNCNANRVKLIVGIGGNNTAELQDFINKFNFDGFHGVLSASPSYNKPSQEGIYQHYRAIAQASPLPVILYNVPGRTASNVSSSTVLRLAHDCNNIIAVKEASGNILQAMEIIKHAPKGFVLISGDDNLSLPLYIAGAKGVISVSANAFPAQMSAMYSQYCMGELDKAQKVHYNLFEITNAMFAEGNPGGVKYILAQMGVMENELRLPLVPISDELKSRIDTMLKLVEN
jgi:4-hydroxy-tetrahydrodipicolinate synthase